MNLKKLKFFCETIKAGSIEKLANSLGMHKTNIGKSIRDLEKELKTKLLKRGYGDLHLTEAGRILYESSRRLFEDFEQVESDLKGTKTNELKEFKISTSIGLGGAWLPIYLKSFVEKFPKINISLLTYIENIELRLENSDVLIHPYLTNRRDLIQRELFSFDFYLYGSEEYIKKYGMPKKQSDLKKHRIVKYDSDGITPFHGVGAFLEDRDFYSNFSQVITVNSPVTELNFVKHNISLGMIANTWGKIENLKLIKIFPKEIMFSEKIYLVYKYSKQKNILIDMLYDILSMNQ